jgi:lysozyme family protein
MTIEEIVRWVIVNFEGNLYTDDPVDAGGATKYGITLRTLQYYRRKVSGDMMLVVTKVDVRDLTLDEAVACGVEVFAVEPKIDQLLDWRVQLGVYDYGFHSGQGRAVQALQAALGIGQDGLIGPGTIRAEANWVGDQRLLALQVLTSREEFMQGVMETRLTQRKWMLGWWKRTTRLQRLVVS